MPTTIRSLQPVCLSLFQFFSSSRRVCTKRHLGSLDAVHSPTSFPPSGQRSRSSLLRLLFGFVPGLRRSSSRTAEGIIAPLSPVVPLSPSQAYPHSPLTPSRSSSYGEVVDSTGTWAAPEFSLKRPPPRRMSPNHSGSSLASHPITRRRGSDM